MDILLVHQNFPGQFKHLGPALARQGHRVVALTLRAGAQPGLWEGVQVLPYRVPRGNTPGLAPWLQDLESKTLRGDACFEAARQLRAQGFAPRAIIAHPGWGESLFLKQVWPQARLGLYAEWFYQPDGTDVDFDPEFRLEDAEATAVRLRLKNVNHWLHADIADAALSPTRWQAGTFPEDYRRRITVVHDGVDTDAVTPDPAVRFELDGQVLTRDDEVVTFVARQLEPYRGYHVFLRALPELLRRRPHARVLIVGADGTAYGAQPPQGQTWKQRFIDEVRPQIPDADWARVAFLGSLPYDRFLNLLRLSRVHTYLTYPFVLSWSLLEAMAVGACVVGSNTPPVREAITHGETGELVDFFDRAALVDRIVALLDDPTRRARLGAAAREHVRAHYDLQRVCLPRQLEWVARLLA